MNSYSFFHTFHLGGLPYWSGSKSRRTTDSNTRLDVPTTGGGSTVGGEGPGRSLPQRTEDLSSLYRGLVGRLTQESHLTGNYSGTINSHCDFIERTQGSEISRTFGLRLPVTGLDFGREGRGSNPSCLTQEDVRSTVLLSTVCGTLLSTPWGTSQSLTS